MLEGFRAARILPILAGACLFVAAPAPALAADASAWDQDVRSAARLIAGSAKDEAGGRVLRAGVEIKLQPGWKTYWRYPGDSGVPPTFDFAGSDNVKNVTVLWPAPTRFTDGGGGQSIGYKDGVVLPLRVVPQVAGKPVVLRLKLDYGACEKLCVPAKAKTELTIAGGSSSQDATVAAAERRVPKRIVVDVVAPAGGTVDLFAEGPTADWALPLPARVAGAPAGVQRFSFELDGLPAGAKPAGATLRFTAVAGEQAVESPYRLD